VEIVRPQCVEYDVDMLQVFAPRGTVDQNIIKNTSMNLQRNGWRTSFIKA
jgi:hypothetical protein